MKNIHSSSTDTKAVYTYLFVDDSGIFIKPKVSMSFGVRSSYFSLVTNVNKNWERLENNQVHNQDFLINHPVREIPFFTRAAFILISILVVFVNAATIKEKLIIYTCMPSLSKKWKWEWERSYGDITFVSLLRCAFNCYLAVPRPIWSFPKDIYKKTKMDTIGSLPLFTGRLSSFSV